MATEEAVKYIGSLLAASDLSQKKFRLLKITATGLDIAGVGDTVVGVNGSGLDGANPVVGSVAFGTAGSAIELHCGEGSLIKVKAGTGGLAYGDKIEPDANGLAVKASASDQASGQACGICVEVGGIAANAIGAMYFVGPNMRDVVTGEQVITADATPIDLTKGYMEWNITGTQGLTLPNGLFIGQQVVFECTAAASTPIGTLTITTPFTGEGATHIFHAAGQKLVFEWRTAGWHMIGKIRAGTLSVVVGTLVLQGATANSGYDLASIYALSVTGTVSSTGNKSIPSGTIQGEFISVRTAVAATIPLGNINVVSTTVPGAAATNLAGINATTCTAQMIWDGASFQALVLNTLTLA